MGLEWKKMGKLATGGPLESGIALAYDPVRKVIAAFGGFGANRDSQFVTMGAAKWAMEKDAGSNCL